MECGGGVALWVGRQLANMATNWRRGVFFEGGVAGGIPPHKGGPKARPPKKQGRGVRKGPLPTVWGWRRQRAVGLLLLDIVVELPGYAELVGAGAEVGAPEHVLEGHGNGAAG